MIRGAILLGSVIALVAGCSNDESAGALRGGDNRGPGTDPETTTPAATTEDAGTSSPEGGAPAVSPTTGANKTDCKYVAHETGLHPHQQAGGLSFNLYAPTSYDRNVGHVAVIILHGQDSNGVPELNAFWKAIADREQLVVIAPKGSRPATNGSATGANWDTPDLALVLKLMTEIDGCYNVFTKKHILWGFSEGGFYGYLLGIRDTDRFSGLAMGGANTGFARRNGYAPSRSKWKVPVSHVHGVKDFNPIALTRQDAADFTAAGHVFTLHEHDGGHTISAAQVRTQYDDLVGSLSP
jgi:poly(3-hydroxybutyrate) depolymerase